MKSQAMKKKTRHEPIIVANPSDLTRQEWLQIRRTGLGGSDAGVALGLNPWCSPLQLYLEKKKDISLNPKSNAITIGNDLEPYVISQAQVLRPGYVERLSSLPMLKHPHHEFMLATPDSGASSKKHGAGIVEAKTALSIYGAKAWSDRTAPAHYRAQCLHYMAVTDRRWCVIVCLAAGPVWHSEVILWDDDEISELIEAEEKLWSAIQNDDFSYLIDGSDSTKNALNLMHPEADEDLCELDLRGNRQAQQMLQQYVTSKRFEKAATEDKKEAENSLKKMLGDHEVAWCDGMKIQWKNTARGRRFTVKEG
tara:strand:- start:2820 stop:3746 length:927 start_codon:yes stop_codon:yes gene_type:complete